MSLDYQFEVIHVSTDRKTSSSISSTPNNESQEVQDISYIHIIVSLGLITAKNAMDTSQKNTLNENPGKNLDGINSYSALSGELKSNKNKYATKKNYSL